MQRMVSKAVFPVAGMGTRFLPATKANPKEMLPIVDKPLIQYAVEEAIDAGIKQLIFVTSSSKRAIEDHFDSNYELESKLMAKEKHYLLSIVRDILPEGVSSVYVRQPDALGLGHAVLCARQIVGDEPFAILLADDLIDGHPKSCLVQMVEAFEDIQSNVLAVEEIDPTETNKYGVVKLKGALVSDRQWIDGIVEKPEPAVAPSNLAVVGRYILMPEIFSWLEKTVPGAGGEIQLTDAIAKLLKSQSVSILKFKGRRYDCGSKLGYLQATLAYGLRHHEVGVQFKAYLDSL